MDYLGSPQAVPGISLSELKARLIEFLRLGGLPEWECGALSYLLLNGTAAAPDIASGAGIPKNKVYDVLESLEKKSLAFQPSASHKKTYRAIRPEEMFERLMAGPNRMGEIRSIVGEFLVEVYEGALEGVEEVTVEQFASVTDSRAAISAMLHDAFKESKSEVRVVTSTFDWLAEQQTLVKVLRDRASAGVTIKLLATTDDKLPARLHDPRFEVRTTNDAVAPCVGIDDSVVIQFVRKGPTKATEHPEIAVRMSSPDAARDTRRLFESSWANAKGTDFEST